MLRILIVATLLLLVSATSARADGSTAPGGRVKLQLGARMGAQAFVQPAVRASMPTDAMHRSINSATGAQQAADGRNGMLALFNVRGDRPGLALPVSDSVSLGLRYRYLEREDIRLEVAETGALDDGYSSHNVIVRARWQFSRRADPLGARSPGSAPFGAAAALPISCAAIDGLSAGPHNSGHAGP